MNEDVFSAAHVQPVAADDDLRLHGHREPHLRRGDDFCAVKSLRRDADDRIAAAIDDDAFADDVRIAAEAPLPAFVTDHTDRVRARQLIIVSCNCAAQHRVDAQHLEVVARDHIPPQPFVDAIVAEAQGREAVADETGKDLVAITKIFIVRIGKRWEHPVIRDVVERHNLPRLGDRQRAQERGVDQTEDGGIRADAEG